MEVVPLPVSHWAPLADLFAAGGDPKVVLVQLHSWHRERAGPVVTWRGVEDPEANLDELIEGYFNDERILAAKLAAERARRQGEPVPPVPEGYDGRLFDWLTEMLNYGPVDGPERAWPIILALIERAPDAETLVFIGSGALEDLVRKAGAEYEDTILDLAVRNARFRVALSAVWQGETVPRRLVECIEAARGRGPEAGS